MATQQVLILSLGVRVLPPEPADGWSECHPEVDEAPSSSGRGRRPLKAVTAVRICSGLQHGTSPGSVPGSSRARAGSRISTRGAAFSTTSVQGRPTSSSASLGEARRGHGDRCTLLRAERDREVERDVRVVAWLGHTMNASSSRSSRCAGAVHTPPRRLEYPRDAVDCVSRFSARA